MLADSGYGVRRSGHQEEQAGGNVEPHWLVEGAFLLVETGGASLQPLLSSLIIIQDCQEGSQLKPNIGSTNPKIEFIYVKVSISCKIRTAQFK